MSLSSYRFQSNASASWCRGRARTLGDFSNPHAPTPIRSTPHTSLVLVLGLHKGEFSAWHGRQSTSSTAHLCRTISYSESVGPSSTGKRKPRHPMLGCLCPRLSLRTDHQARAAGAGTAGCGRDLTANEGHAVSDLHGSLRHPPLILALSTGSSWGAVRPRKCVRSLFMMPGNVCHVARRPGCASARDHANPATCRPGGHDGDLRKCQLGGHTRGAAAAWRDPALRSLLYFAAVPTA
jgi:hypothetical protein